MVHIIISIFVLVFMTITSCSTKVSTPIKIVNKSKVLNIANANFKELEEESQKSPKDLTLPKNKKEAILPGTDKKKTNDKKYKVKTKYPIKNGYPVWVYNPNYGGYIGAVGIAKKVKGGYSQQKRLAVIIAQSNLAKQIRLIVNTKIYTKKIKIDKNSFEIYKSYLKSLSKQEADVYLKNIIVKDEWIDPKTGDLYVWVVLRK